MTIAYPVRQNLYLNITNRCPCDCTFCLRKNADGVYGSDSLWLDHEPSVDEILQALDGYELTAFDELVFCGYGEPTERLDALLAVARAVKSHVPSLPIRLNTNGLADLIHGGPVAQRLAGLVDTVSISLNTPDPEEYLALCRPVFGAGSWQAMISFARACRAAVPHVVFSIVGAPVTTSACQEKCRAIAADVGAELRIRPYEPGV